MQFDVLAGRKRFRAHKLSTVAGGGCKVFGWVKSPPAKMPGEIFVGMRNCVLDVTGEWAFGTAGEYDGSIPSRGSVSDS